MTLNANAAIDARRGNLSDDSNRARHAERRSPRRAQERVRLSEHVGRRVKLTKRGPDWWGLCVFHNEKTSSFSVNDAKGFYHCFGCGAHGDVLDWWRLVEGLTFDEALERLRREAGEPSTNSLGDRQRRDGDVERKQADARAIWRATLPIVGTIAETYLRHARCVGLTLPDCLRFHPALAIGPRELGEAPALVAAVTTWAALSLQFRRNVSCRKLNLRGRRQSMAERALGPVGQGAVCLAPAGIVTGLAKGIETGLSAMELFRLPVWCVLGSNLAA